MRYLFEVLSEEAVRRGRAGFDLRRAVEEQLTRVVVPGTGGPADAEPGLLDWGVGAPVEPDAATDSGMERLARRIERLVTLFEPRLEGPRAEVERTGNPLAPYRVILSGHLAGAEEEEPFRFPLEIADRG